MVAILPCRLTALLVALLPTHAVSVGWLSSFFFGSEAETHAGQLQTVSVPLQKQYVPIKRNGNVVAYKTAYFGNLRVGTPPRNYTAVFDTGSGHLILPSARCKAEGCVRHKTYNHSLSSTSVELEHDGRLILPDTKKRDQVSITFGTGKVVGEFAQDEVCVGEAGEQCFKLRIVVANSMTSDPFALFDFDGVLGLGLSALSLNPHFSFFGQMAIQHPAMQPMFSCFLARTETDGTSHITFGGYEQKHMDSDLLWAPVNNPEKGYWQVKIRRVRIGSIVLQDCESGECVAVLDTGTSLLGVPKLAVAEMHKALARPVPEELAEKAQGGIDCRSVPGELLHFDLMGSDVPFSVTLSVEDHSRPAPVDMRQFLTSATGNASAAAGNASAAVGNASTATVGTGEATAAAAKTNGTADGVAEAKGTASDANATDGSDDRPDLWCRSLLLPVDKGPLGPRMFIWGEPVLRKYYTVYDWAEKRIGFAGARQPEESAAAVTSSIGAPSADSLVIGAPLAGNVKA